MRSSASSPPTKKATTTRAAVVHASRGDDVRFEADPNSLCDALGPGAGFVSLMRDVTLRRA
jgi:hypothetical protein